MHFLLLIHASEKDWEAASSPVQAEVMRRHEELERDLRATGRYKGCGGLAPASSAKVVRHRDGKPIVTDGPFAEAREQVGGYYLVEANDVEEATAIAARIPGVADAAVEVRALRDVRF